MLDVGKKVCRGRTRSSSKEHENLVLGWWEPRNWGRQSINEKTSDGLDTVGAHFCYN